jgi:epoxide hydrolase 4
MSGIERVDLALPQGIGLACLGSGAASGRRVMLLHGFPEGAFVWEEVMGALAPDARCLAPYLRGYAPSSAPSDVAMYRPRWLVGDLVAAIEAWGAPLDVLVAHDWGGALAWNLAASRPDLLRHLLIVNAPHPATFLRELRQNPAQQAASAYMTALCEPGAEARLAADDHAALWPFFGEASWLTPDLRDRYRHLWQHGLTGPLNYYRASPLRPPRDPGDALHSLQLPPELVTVRVPTTVLWGEGDHALLPGLLDGLEAFVPDLRVRRVPGATHWLVHEQPGLVVDAVRGALA